MIGYCYSAPQLYCWFVSIYFMQRTRALAEIYAESQFRRPPMGAVGMPVTRHSPHRSQRALLTHWAPPSGTNVSAELRHKIRTHQAPRGHILLSRSAYNYQVDRRSYPALCSDRGVLIAVPLRQRPSRHRLRRGQALFVRPLRRYYYAVRLLIHVHVHRSACAFMNRPGPVRA